MSRRTLYHPLNQPISQVRYSVGLNNIIPANELREGNAPGPFRIERVPLVGNKNWLEIVGVTIYNLNFDETPPEVPEDHPEGPFTAASLKFYIVNVFGSVSQRTRQRPGEGVTNAYISLRGGVYGYRFGDSRDNPPQPLGYLINPESLAKEEAAIVELGSKLYRRHKEAEADSAYQIPPLSIFRSGVDVEKLIAGPRGAIKHTKVVPN